MEALIHLEAHITATGYPDWLTQGMKNVGHFKAETFMDYAAEELEKARAEVKTPGMQVRVVRIGSGTTGEGADEERHTGDHQSQ